MKIEKPFNFTLFRDIRTNNFISVGSNTFFDKYVLKPTATALNSEILEIDKNIFDSFFVSNNLEIIRDFKQNLVINTKK